jgi:hypothetical protein
MVRKLGELSNFLAKSLRFQTSATKYIVHFDESEF